MKILRRLFLRKRKRKPGRKLPECVAHLAMPRPQLVCCSVVDTTYRTPTLHRRKI